MTRTFLTRLVGVLALAIGLALSVMANSASAQVVDRPAPPTLQVQTQAAAAPGSPVQTLPGGPSDAAAPNVAAASNPCGFFTRWDAYYNHCGYNSITIRVNFWYGANYRDITVWPGTSNLSTHPYLQGAGMITNAWCIRNC